MPDICIECFNCNIVLLGYSSLGTIFCCLCSNSPLFVLCLTNSKFWMRFSMEGGVYQRAACNAKLKVCQMKNDKKNVMKKMKRVSRNVNIPVLFSSL